MLLVKIKKDLFLAPYNQKDFDKFPEKFLISPGVIASEFSKGGKEVIAMSLKEVLFYNIKTKEK